MKLPAYLALLITTTISLRAAELSPVNMSVELINKMTPKGSGKTLDLHDKTQTRSLKISLNNNSANSFDSLVVKYWFIGHAEGSRETKVITAGERKSALTPRGKDVVESEQASAHFVEEHYASAKGGKGKPTKIPASGEKITGHAVRVMHGDKVLAESYSEPSFKAIVEKTGAAAPAAAAAPGSKPAKK